METNKDDKLMKDFFLKHKVEIDDNHFTERVMQQLPEKRNFEWIIVLLAGIGTILSIILGWNSKISVPSFTLPAEFSLYYLLGIVFLSPFVLWFGFELHRRRYFNLI